MLSDPCINFHSPPCGVSHLIILELTLFHSHQTCLLKAGDTLPKGLPIYVKQFSFPIYLKEAQILKQRLCIHLL